MNTILIEKIKQALKKSHPIEAIRELVSEYEEIHRLAIWRNRIIKDGYHLDRHTEEIERIDELLENSGYYFPFSDEDILADIKKYFKELKKR